MISSLKIEPISNQLAMSLVVRHHYLHRKCPCSFAFGLFDDFDICGVICYGTPSSSTLRAGICGIDQKDNVIELTRLWVRDDIGRNAESYLIGNTIRRVNKEIIVSFAEIDQGHVGIVYQATNWIYTGLSAKRTNWMVRGIKKHSQTIADKYTAAELREKYGTDFYSIDRPRKHRYIYFNCSKTRKKQLMKMLRYPILPYPKPDPNFVPKPIIELDDEIENMYF